MKYTPAKPPLTGETLATLTARLQAQGEPAFRAKQILEWVYKKRARSWDDMTNLPKALRTWLDATFELMPAALVLRFRTPVMAPARVLVPALLTVRSEPPPVTAPSWMLPALSSVV